MIAITRTKERFCVWSQKNIKRWWDENKNKGWSPEMGIHDPIFNSEPTGRDLMRIEREYGKELNKPFKKMFDQSFRQGRARKQIFAKDFNIDLEHASGPSGALMPKKERS